VIQKSEELVKQEQEEHWQESKRFLYCFPNEKDERYFKFSGISDKI